MNRLRVMTGEDQRVQTLRNPQEVAAWMWGVGAVMEFSMDEDWYLWIRKMVKRGDAYGLEYYYSFKGKGDYKLSIMATADTFYMRTFLNGVERQAWRFEGSEIGAMGVEKLGLMAVDELEQARTER